MRSLKLALLTVGAGMALGLLGACGSDETSDNTGGTGGQGASTSSSSTGGPTSVSSSSASVTSSSTGGTGGAPPGEGVCGTDLSYGEGVVDGCITGNCCTTFDPCVADAECAACLESQDPEGDGCLDNALFAAYDTCRAAECPLTICGSDLSLSGQSGPLLNYHACISEACCAEFDPCVADVDCNACLLDPTIATCAENALFTAFTTCRDTNCPGDVCESQIGFVTNYEEFEVSDPNPAANKCIADACCAEITACADPDPADGYVENDPESAACLACLQDPANCAPASLKAAAEAFIACFEATDCFE